MDKLISMNHIISKLAQFYFTLKEGFIFLPHAGAYSKQFVLLYSQAAPPIYQTVDSFYRNADIDFHTGLPPSFLPFWDAENKLWDAEKSLLQYKGRTLNGNLALVSAIS